MSRNYNRGRDNRSQSGGSETNIPSHDVIKSIIQDKDKTDELVKRAEEIGRGLAKNEKLATAQIRSFFSEVKRIEGFVQENGKVDKRRLILLKPQLAYQARRQIVSHKGTGVAKLEQVLSPAIGFVGDNMDYFRNFVDFFEAILAYHKAQGGK